MSTCGAEILGNMHSLYPPKRTNLNVQGGMIICCLYPPSAAALPFRVARPVAGVGCAGRGVGYRAIE